jgi:hypothetical protein
MTCVAAGHKYTVILISIVKRLLASPGLARAEQLRLLEQLNDLAPADVLAMVEPASDGELAIIAEAEALDSGRDKLLPSFGILTGARGWNALTKLNPSLDRAARIGIPVKSEPASPAATQAPQDERLTDEERLRKFNSALQEVQAGGAPWRHSF